MFIQVFKFLLKKNLILIKIFFFEKKINFVFLKKI